LPPTLLVREPRAGERAQAKTIVLHVHVTTLSYI
jgi:hypothetical protein